MNENTETEKASKIANEIDLDIPGLVDFRPFLQ